MKKIIDFHTSTTVLQAFTPITSLVSLSALSRALDPIQHIHGPCDRDVLLRPRETSSIESGEETHTQHHHQSLRVANCDAVGNSQHGVGIGQSKYTKRSKYEDEDRKVSAPFFSRAPGALSTLGRRGV